MNDALKAAGRIGAELGAAKAELERLRGLLRDVACRALLTGWEPGLTANIHAALSQPTDPVLSPWTVDIEGQRAEPAPAQDEPLDQRMLDHFTCRREDNAGGTPDFTLYFTKMGAHHEYQLYRNEAAALHANLGKALGIARPAQTEQQPEQSQAATDVLAERRRQVEAEGWTPEHDDKHAGGQLADAAACYALWSGGINPDNWSQFWPWDHCWLKHSDPRRMLVKAGALILAEIERLDRAARSSQGDRNV